MNRSALTAVLDACVLYPAGLRNLLMWLAVNDLFQPKWSESIHEEWMRSVLDDRPDLTRAQLERTRELMDRHAGDCLVTEFESHIDRITLPDDDDRHVLAVAIESNADVIVTWNLQDFPAKAVDPFGIAVLDPDQFLVALIEHDEDSVIQAMKEHRESLKYPPSTPQEYFENLRSQRLWLSCDLLSQRMNEC